MTLEFSVLMPMLNPGRHLGFAVESVLSQYGCTLELLIIDDGSTDGSREWIESLSDPRIRLLSGPRSGIAACLNVGLRAARGRFIARCDADDLFEANRLRMQCQWLDLHPEAVAVCGPFRMIAPDGANVANPWFDRDLGERLDIAQDLLTGRCSTTLCSFAIRRTAPCVADGFRPYFETAEDIDFTLRLAESGPIGFLPSCTYAYRLHDASITHSQPTPRRQFFERMARQFSVQRLDGRPDDLMLGQAPEPPGSKVGMRSPLSASRHRSDLLVGEAWEAVKRGARSEGFTLARRAVLESPGSVQAWKAFLLIGLRRH